MGLCGIVANAGEIQGLTDVFLPSTGIRINQRGQVATDDVIRKHRDPWVMLWSVCVCAMCVCTRVELQRVTETRSHEHGKDRSTALQHLPECSSQIFILFQLLVFIVPNALCYPPPPPPNKTKLIP